MKRCRLCKKLLSDNCFTLKANSKTKLSKTCNNCRLSPMITWSKRNPERSRAATIRHQISGGARKGRLSKQYKMTIDDYGILLKKQNGKCAICGSSSPGGRWSAFHIDHNHKTGKIRGLLCTSCNRGIGYLQDSPKLLKVAMAYLKSSC